MRWKWIKEMKIKKEQGDRLSDNVNQNYNREEFNEKQWIEIQEGLNSGIDVSLYANRFLHFKDMRLIRLGQEAELDVSILSDPKLNCRQREEIYLGLLSGMDVSSYANDQYNEWKMREIRLGYESGYDLKKYLDTHNHNQIHQIRLGLEANLDVTKYDNVKYKQAHMEELRMALMNSLDIRSLSDCSLSIEEIRKRRISLQSGREPT
jgi:hypothetical protein